MSNCHFVKLNKQLNKHSGKIFLTCESFKCTRKSTFGISGCILTYIKEEKVIRQLQISEARRRLNELHKELGPDETVSITSRGKQVFALMPWELYEALNETIEIMGDPEMMAALKRGVQDIQSGRLTDWEKAKTELEIEL
jgi:prevent-host-death family protein